MATSMIKGNNDTGWQTLKQGIKYRKLNGVVYLNIENLTATATSGTEAIGTLPIGCRPGQNVNIQPFIRKGTVLVGAWITSGGQINVSAISGSGTYAGEVSFPAG